MLGPPYEALLFQEEGHFSGRSSCPIIAIHRQLHSKDRLHSMLSTQWLLSCLYSFPLGSTLLDLVLVLEEQVFNTHLVETGHTHENNLLGKSGHILSLVASVALYILLYLFNLNGISLKEALLCCVKGSLFAVQLPVSESKLSCLPAVWPRASYWISLYLSLLHL